MARLIFRALAFALLLGGCRAALAEPVTLAIGTWFATASAFTIATVAFTVLSTAYSVYGAIQAKKKARAAAQRAAEQEAANLKDRTTTLITADAPLAVVYGSPAPIGGSILAMLTSGDNDQFKHVVFAVAAHECDSVEAVFMGGDWVGNLDPAGYANGELFALDAGVPRDETHSFVLAPVMDPDTGLPSELGYWTLPLAHDADGFALHSILDPGGAPYGATVQLSWPLGSFRGRALSGPIGAAGTISYSVRGGGSALNIQIHTSPGGVDTADAFLRAARSDQWTVDHKLSGYTYLVVTMNLLLERFQGGVPEITVKLRGKKVFDYRSGQTVYSRNPALCLADFIRSEAGYGADVAQIDIDAVIAAANACDVAVYNAPTVVADPATYGDSLTRYTCDGMFRSDQDRDATRQQIEDSMVGASLESGGVWRILAGAWSTPVLALGDDDMVMPMSIVQTCNVGTARYNGAKGTYVNAVRNGVTEDFTPYVNAVFRAQDVKDKFLDVTLSFTGNHVRTQQIARVLVEQSRGGLVVQIYPKMFAWNLQPGDRVVLSSGLFGFANKPFRVQDWTYQAGTPVALQCVEDEEAFYDQADETRADAAPNTALPSPFLKPAPPLDLIVLSGESQMVQQDGVMVVRAKVSWTQSPDPAVQRTGTVRVQYRLAADGEAWQNVDLPGDAVELYLLGLAVNNVYVIRVQFLTAYASSAWSVVQHELHGREGPPDSVLGFDVRAELTGIFGHWAEPEGIDLLGWSATQIRRGPSWLLAEANILFDGRASSANLGWFPAGSQAVWAAHHNTIGQWSEPVFDTIEILPPAQPLPGATVNNRNQVTVVWGDCKTTQPIDFYEIRIGETWDATTVLAQVRSTNYNAVQPKFGEQRYWVIAVDVAGNRGAPGYAIALTLAAYDSVIGNLRNIVDRALDQVAQLQMQGALNGDRQLQRTRAGIYEKIEVVVNDATAMASKFTALSATVDDNQAIVSSQITTLSTTQSAMASELSLVAAVSAGNTAAIATETTARTTAISALASQVTTIQSSVGSLTGTVEVQGSTLASLNGNVAAQYMIRTEAISGTGIRAMAGLSIGVSAGSGATPLQSAVAVFANEFYVLPDASTPSFQAPFRVEGGTVYINVAKIKDADIGTLKVAGFALTISLAAQGSGSAALAFTVPGGQVWRAVSIATSGSGPRVGDPYSCTLASTGATPMEVVAPQVATGGGEVSDAAYQAGGMTIVGVNDYGPGTHTVTATWTGAGSGVLTPATVTLLLDLQKRGG